MIRFIYAAVGKGIPIALFRWKRQTAMTRKGLDQNYGDSCTQSHDTLVAASFTPARSYGKHMLNEIDSLFEEQRQSWPRLARGVEGLAQARTRRMRIDWFDVFVRHIPHRVTRRLPLSIATPWRNVHVFSALEIWILKSEECLSIRTTPSIAIRFQSSVTI